MLATTPPPDPRAYVLMWSGILIVAILLAFGIYSWFKRWMNADEESTPIGFTLSDLRELHRQGKISDEEFEQTKSNMLAGAKQAADRMPAVLHRRSTKPETDNPESPPPSV